MQIYKKEFSDLLGVKNSPNIHEQHLYDRAQYFIRKLAWIPGIQMISIVNSLSMYATHEDSDIDLCIVTRPGYLWMDRFLVTLTLWWYGVWRHGEDIAGFFCLSFWITTEALDMRRIALEEDIYLYYWIFFMKPILERECLYDEFLQHNDWVIIDMESQIKNRQYLIDASDQSIHPIAHRIYRAIDSLVRLCWYPRTMRHYMRLGRPGGVIIHADMLKFHDRDRRASIRDQILDIKKSQKHTGV